VRGYEKKGKLKEKSDETIKKNILFDALRA
jgi:hypothetical protein